MPLATPPSHSTFLELLNDAGDWLARHLEESASILTVVVVLLLVAYLLKHLTKIGNKFMVWIKSFGFITCVEIVMIATWLLLTFHATAHETISEINHKEFLSTTATLQNHPPSAFIHLCCMSGMTVISMLVYLVERFLDKWNPHK